jgi:hypothetical protein
MYFSDIEAIAKCLECDLNKRCNQSKLFSSLELDRPNKKGFKGRREKNERGHFVE